MSSVALESMMRRSRIERKAFQSTVLIHICTPVMPVQGRKSSWIVSRLPEALTLLGAAVCGFLHRRPATAQDASFCYLPEALYNIGNVTLQPVVKNMDPKSRRLSRKNDLEGFRCTTELSEIMLKCLWRNSIGQSPSKTAVPGPSFNPCLIQPACPNS